jgi:hypothetical protein
MLDPPARTRLAWLLLAIAMTAGSLAFWLFDALPYQDLPAHTGGHRDPPKVCGVELGELGSRVLGPLGAVRALGTLPVLATPLALVFARRRLHQDPALWAGFLGSLSPLGS